MEAEAWETRGLEGYRRWKNSGGKWDSQGGGKREKLRKILQHCIIFCNRNRAKRGRREKGEEGKGEIEQRGEGGKGGKEGKGE